MPPRDVSSRSELEQLSERVGELERRISALEHPPQAPSDSSKTAVVAIAPRFAVAVNGPADAIPAERNILAVLGTAVLGIAGAYVLRAIAESGVFAAWIPVTAALLYGAGWLVWAARPRIANGTARNCYAITSALILTPLLWESTVRFRMLAPPMAAAVLVAFAALAIALAWRTNRASVAWSGVLTAAITGLILMIATRALLPFAVSMLGMVLLIELTAIRGRWVGLRTLVAFSADFAMLIVVLILGNATAVPSEYRSVRPELIVALAAALFAMYTASILTRSLAFQLKITVFDASQLVLVVLLASWAVMRAMNSAGRTALGAAFFVIGAGCYFVSFAVLARHRERPNFYFYTTCGVVFVLTASFLALSAVPLVIWLSLAALIATVLGVYWRSPALDLHGVVYLVGAVTGSGLLDYAGRALAGGYPGFPGPLPIVAALAALVCIAIISRYRVEHLGDRVFRLLPAVLAVYAIAGLAIVAPVWLVAHAVTPTRPQLAVIRTIVTCAAVLLLAFVGARWNRRELVWIAYAAAVLGSLKLAFEDLRFGTTQSLAVSLLIYGAVLILIPRLVRAGSVWPEKQHDSRL